MFQQINGQKKRDSGVLFAFSPLLSPQCVRENFVCPVINRKVVYEVLRWLFFSKNESKNSRLRFLRYIFTTLLSDRKKAGHQLREMCSLAV